MRKDRSLERFNVGDKLDQEPVVFAPDFKKANCKTAVISGTIATVLIGDEGQNYVVLIDGTTIKTWCPYLED